MKTQNHKSINWQSLLALTVVMLGGILMIMKIYSDSEPGAIPLLLIMGGTTGYIICRVQMRSQNSL